MHNSEIIPALIARIRQNNTDNVVIRIMKVISEQNKLIKEEYDNSNK